tara:strand:- start:50 stop:304 length:255 start_codon:yes stop_codon:yes gene_type:complete
MTNRDDLKKQIIYRSNHRGTKEMDLLLGNFVKIHIEKFNESELKDLDNLIKIEDDILSKWYFDKPISINIPDNKISKLLKKFKI